MVRSKLNEKEIDCILDKAKNGELQYKIASEYKIGIRRLVKILEDNNIDLPKSNRKERGTINPDVESFVLQLRGEKKNISEISKIANLCKRSVVKILKKHDIDTSKTFWREPSFSKSLIKDYLNGESQNKVVAKYKTSYSTFEKILSKYHIKVRGSFKHSIDESYFESINTPNKAYFFGLLMADGCVTKTRPQYNFAGKLSISLQKRDGYILERFKKDIKYKGNIIDRKSKKQNEQDSKIFTVGNIKICKDLENLGMKMGKTFDCDFPSCIPEDLISHFVRGFFDGDGGATISEYNGRMKYNIGIVGTENFISKLVEVLKQHTDEKVQMIKSPKDNIVLYFARISSQKGIEDFSNFIYKDAKIYLNRKRKKIEEILNFKISRKNKEFMAISPSGEEFRGKIKKEFEEICGLTSKQITSYIHNKRKSPNGWSFKYI